MGVCGKFLIANARKGKYGRRWESCIKIRSKKGLYDIMGIPTVVYVFGKWLLSVQERGKFKCLG